MGRYGQTRTRMAKIHELRLNLKVDSYPGFVSYCNQDVEVKLMVNGDTMSDGDTLFSTICRASSVSRHPPLGWQPPFLKGNTVYTEDGKEGTIFEIYPESKSLWLDFADGTRTKITTLWQK